MKFGRERVIPIMFVSQGGWTRTLEVRIMNDAGIADQLFIVTYD
jgi:hypothetical protein